VSLVDRFIDMYLERVKLKHMFLVPLMLLVLSLGVLSYTYVSSGSPVKLGVEFRGGVIVTFDSDKSPLKLREEFSAYPVIQARAAGNQRMVEFKSMSREQSDSLVAYVNSRYGGVQIRQTGEIISASNQRQTLKAIIFSFLGMAVVVFVIFRTIVPSFAVVLSAFMDIILAMAMMDVTGVELSLGTVAALLMLIGYSVDTDILLTTRLLKRRGALNSKIRDAMRTGLTMTFTTLAALVVLFAVSSGSYLISSFSRIDIIRDISVVLIFGLLADLVNTWMTNTGILRWYIERRGAKR